MKPKVLTIVATFNAGPYITDCLNSLIGSTFETDVIIIDNGSTDGTTDTIHSKFPELDFIVSKTNLGFGKANNIGLRKALKENYDFAFLLNQDAWIQADTLGELITFHTSNPEYGILSPLHLNGAGDAVDPKFSSNLHLRNPMYLDDLLFERVQKAYDVKFVNAALWLIPLKTLQDVGGFNEFYFMYGEDGDLCERVRHHGMKIGVVPKARGHHARYNAYYAKKKGLANVLFTARNWRRWSYEKVTCLSNSTRQGFLKSIENAIIGITKNTIKRQFSTAIGIGLGWWVFLFSYPTSLRDRRLIAQPGPHFISN